MIYGCRLYPNKLKDIVNRHLSTAIDEIEREGSIQRNEMAMINLMKNILIGAKKILKKANRYRVPHCSGCERCQCTDFVYKDYYCCEENDTMRRFGSLV